jgi:hypothetical protein
MSLARVTPAVHTRSIGAHVASVGLGGTTEGGRGAVLREIGIVLFGALVYFGMRLVVEGDQATAIRNAERIIELEQRWGIDIERSAQDLVLENPVLRVLGNLSYVWLHWPLLIAALFVVYRRDRVVYLRLRRALLASGAVGLLAFWLVPTAPPRFMPGFEGTVSDAARRHYLNYPLDWANPYASFPSFHVGWTLIACLAVAATLPSVRARVVAMVPAVLVALAVVTTGNHYVIDAVVGVVIAVSAYVVAASIERAPSPPAEADTPGRPNSLAAPG